MDIDLAPREDKVAPRAGGADGGPTGHPDPAPGMPAEPARNAPAGVPLPRKDGAPDRKSLKKKRDPGREAPPPGPAAEAVPRTEPAGQGGERSVEAESGKGEPVCAYGVEVVELLEMEPLDGHFAWPRRSRPYHRYASAAFFAVFILGLLNAAAVLLYYSPVQSPDELASGSCEIAGEVRDARGDPVPNALVVLTDSTRSTSTNSDGWYVLKDVPAGTHRVEASADGFGTMSVRVDLRPNLLRNIDFTLERGGPEVRLDESGTTDWGQSGRSYLWATPVLLVLSVLALAAALLSLRREVSRTVLALGSASALSFGFGLGAVLAIIGVLLAAMQLRQREGPPLKKLRVGISYPRRRTQAAPPQAAPSGGAGFAIKEKYSVDVDEQENVQSTEAGPASDRSGAGAPGPEEVPVVQATLATNAAPAAPAVLARSDIEEVEVYLKERSLRAQMASAEIEPSATLGRGEIDREAAPRPRRFVRRSKKGRVLCFVCVNEIGAGHEYLRCSCGKTMHVSCLREPRCPDCGCSFRKEG